MTPAPPLTTTGWSLAAGFANINARPATAAAPSRLAVSARSAPPSERSTTSGSSTEISASKSQCGLLGVRLQGNHWIGDVRAKLEQPAELSTDLELVQLGLCAAGSMDSAYLHEYGKPPETSDCSAYDFP
jgi:hypothetical protein